MKKNCLLLVSLLSVFLHVIPVAAQNIAINTTGTTAAVANMFEVIQPATAPTHYVSIFAKNLSTGTNAYAIWAEVTETLACIQSF